VLLIGKVLEMSYSQRKLSAGRTRRDRLKNALSIAKQLRNGQIRQIDLTSSKANAARIKGGKIGSHDHSYQTVAHHLPISKKDDRFKTPQQLEKEYMARYRLDGFFFDEVEYLNLYTGEVLSFPKYVNYEAVARAFALNQKKNGLYDFGMIVRLKDYLPTL